MPSTPSRSLATAPNPHPDRDYEVSMVADEFTCVCPMTEQPDFATPDPRRFCVAARPRWAEVVGNFKIRGVIETDGRATASVRAVAPPRCPIDPQNAFAPDGFANARGVALRSIRPTSKGTLADGPRFLGFDGDHHPAPLVRASNLGESRRFKKGASHWLRVA
jgi:hypothetical protein